MSANIIVTPFAATQNPTSGSLALASRISRMYLAVINNLVGAGASNVAFKLGAQFLSDQNEVQQVLQVATPTAGVYRLKFKGLETVDLAYNAVSDTVEEALEDLANIGEGNITAVVATAGGNTTITLTFIGTLAKLKQDLVTVSKNTLTSAAGTDDVQTLTFAPTPQDGTFKISFGGQTSVPITFDALAADIQAALENLSSIGAGNVSVTGDMPGPVAITFAGALAKSPQALFTAASLLQNAASEVTAVQTIQATNVPDSGNFQIQHGADVSAVLPYNVTAAALQAALRAFPSLPGNSLTVTGSFTTGFVVTFTGIIGPVSPLTIVGGDTLLLGGNVDDQTPAEMTGGIKVFVAVANTTPGVGEVPVAITVTHTTPGVIPSAVVCTVSETTAGSANDPNEGYVLKPGDKQEFEGEATPADAVYVRSISADLTIQVAEG